MADLIPATSLRIPEPLKAAVKAKAASEGRTLTDVTLEFYRRYVGERVVYDALPAEPEHPPADYVPYGERRPYTVADNLDDLTGPTTGVVTFPHHIKWSGTPTSDLDVPGVLMVTYETVLAEASTVADLNQFLNREALIALWPVMHLPPKIRRIWEERFPILADTQTKDVV